MRLKDARRAFTGKLGAHEDVSGDHIYYYYQYQGAEYTVGKLSHSWSGTLNDTQVNMLSKKLRLRKNEFEHWVECTMTNEIMIGLWQSRRTTEA
jgi:hypothetical protein